MNDTLTTPGALLMGKYRVEKVLGQGAMGIVVAATHLGFGTQVAMKFMLPGKSTSVDRRQRFLQEARIAARLTSAHAGRVLDVGTMDLEGTETPYLVMEYLEGKDLDAVLEERGVLPFAEAVGYVLQVCEAVAEAHRAGIVHRDLKPANLFLTRFADGSPCVKVLDFGVSKLIEPGANLTQATAVLGSPLYMSPEQMEASKDVDARSDVWALGIVLYQLVANLTPFHGEAIQQVCTRVFFSEPTPLATFRAGAPPGFEAVLFRCFEKRREQRFQNVAELAAALVPFAPARAVVHAERAAGILGLNVKPAHETFLLPQIAPVAPEATAAVSRWAPALTDTAPAGAAPPQASSRRRPLVALGIGGAVLVVAISGVALSLATAKPTPVLPSPAPSATSATAEPAPVTSAAPSAIVATPPPHVTPPPSASALHAPARPRASAAPPKKDVLDR
jgi:eukaryotic-like serine/threonine-protein kinase